MADIELSIGHDKILSAILDLLIEVKANQMILADRSIAQDMSSISEFSRLQKEHDLKTEKVRNYLVQETNKKYGG